jgi:hypothetical protein
MKIPDSTRRNTEAKIREHAQERWPDLKSVSVRYRGNFAYIDAVDPDGDALPLCRLRYVGWAASWGFAIYLASSDKYEDSFLPNGTFMGTPEEALDCACGLYLGDITAWRTAAEGASSEREDLLAGVPST